MAEIVIMPALLLGLILGLYEAIILHRDVTIPTHRFAHMLHALILAIAFVFASINVDFVFATFPGLKGIAFIGQPIVFRIAIGLIAAIKIHGTSYALRGAGMATAGMAETWFHSILIGGLIIAAPYLLPLIRPALPAWLAR